MRLVPRGRPTGATGRTTPSCWPGPTARSHRYRKIHRFAYGGEDGSFDAGSERVTVDVEGLRVSLFVCYDLRFADEWWAVAPETDLYLCVANWPEPRRAHWSALLRARAIENQAYVVACNRVGTGGSGSGDTLDYAGDSAIVDPMGEALATGARTEALLVADVDGRPGRRGPQGPALPRRPLTRSFCRLSTARFAP